MQGFNETVFVKALEQGLAPKKEFNEQHHQLPSVMLCVHVASYLGNAPVIGVSVVPSSHYYKPHHSEDYSLGFSMMTRIFYYLLLSNILKFTENTCAFELTSVICRRQIRCKSHLRDKEIVG